MGTLREKHFLQSTCKEANMRNKKMSTTLTDHKTSMLDYLKLVLDKVRFSHDLFTKEYHKGLKLLDPIEQAELKQWLGIHDNGIENTGS
ncbi:MAG: hypothetical protein ABJG41_05040 [Cyclobacteriaceae bacterium]